MGEDKKSIFVVGSPDVDLILSKNLPSINEVKKRYEIEYDKYSSLLKNFEVLWVPGHSKVEGNEMAD